MILQDFLSNRGKHIEDTVNLSAGTLAWGLRATKKAKEMDGFINATIGSATEDDGKLMVLPTLVKELSNLTGDQIFSYANMRGVNEFVVAWKKDTIDTYPDYLREGANTFSTLPITACGGLTGGLMISAQVLFDKGDVIIAPNSRWGNIDNVFFKNLQLKESTYELLDKEGNLNFDNLISKIHKAEKEEKKIGIYLNFPNNPSGISPSYDEVKKFQEVVEEISIPTTIFLDDAYEGCVYEDSVIEHSLFPHLIGLNENVLTVKVDGVSKRYYAYGARLGLVTLGFGEEVSEEDMVKARELIAKATRTNTSSSPKGIQVAMSNVLNDPEKNRQVHKEKKRNISILEARYNYLKKLLGEKESSILQPVSFNSGFFGYFLIKGKQPASEISHKLLEKGLGTVPFENTKNGLNGVRVAFCSISESNIEKAVNILYSV
ncbi:MAG: aminotransferase class I/II-fold pyridoxal phosphate-dependent enzyme [Candidatus Heimdallarchaeota archaeon]|nr:aminotransferase class I/II-fold pyridoxal phosphate-dependent enzyme [Candidatus Heimdallarchaeota archaeon]